MRRAGRNSFLALGDKYRIYILLLVVFAFMSLFAPRFFTISNFTAILNAIALNATAAIGFTVVMICGQLDLSIGSVVTFSGALALGLQPVLGFPGAIVAAVVGGALVGLLNGVLVAKAKINSFIVTLGTMTILQGTVYQFSGGNSISVSNDQAFAISDFLSKNLLPLVTPRILITLALLVVVELILVAHQGGAQFLYRRREPRHGLACGHQYGPLHRCCLRAFRRDGGDRRGRLGPRLDLGHAQPWR